MVALLPLVLELTGALTASASTEVRLRASDAAPVGPVVEVELAPALEVLLESRRMRYALSYLPRITLVDTGHLASTPLLLSEAEARVEGRARQQVLSLSERVRYGDLNLSAAPLLSERDLAGEAFSPGATQGIARIGSSTTTLSAQRTWRRWVVDSSLGYQLDGGLDASSRALLPFQSGPFAAGSAGYALSRVSRAATEVSASSVSFSSGPTSVLFGVEQGLIHRWSRTMETRVAFGVVGAQSRVSDDAPQRNDAYPTVGLGVEHDVKQPNGSLEVHLGLHLAPSVNRLLGFVDQRVQASAAGVVRRGAFSTLVLAAASDSVPSGSALATSLLAAELSETWQASKAVIIGVGLRGSRQQQPLTRTGPTQGTVFVSLTLLSSWGRF